MDIEDANEIIDEINRLGGKLHIAASDNDTILIAKQIRELLKEIKNECVNYYMWDTGFCIQDKCRRNGWNILCEPYKEGCVMTDLIKKPE